jgi:cytochrome c oxidase subunit 2
MDGGFRFFPEQASTTAASIDDIVFYLLAVTTVMTGLVFFLVLVFCAKYRRRPGRETGVQVKPNPWLEATWIGVPIVLVLIMFFWGASAYFPIYRAPSNSLDVYVVARQWMWKLQHAEGAPEINELHVPLGRPIRLTMTSQDVIHSFYVPAFRVKQDVLPGRYTTIWFEPKKLGEFHLFCAEYCGSKHSGMVGKIVVLPPAEYERWLSGGISQGSLASGGHRLFLSLGCANCHTEAADARCPNLVRLYGSAVRLQGGGEVTADESYIRESILDPTAKVVSGYQPIMPSFRGRVSEEELIQLVAYVKSLGPTRETGRDK